LIGGGGWFSRGVGKKDTVSGVFGRILRYTVEKRTVIVIAGEGGGVLRNFEQRFFQVEVVGSHASDSGVGDYIRKGGFKKGIIVHL